MADSRVNSRRATCSRCTADHQMAKMPPVNLRLFAGQTAQTQKGFRWRPWPVAGDNMAELAWPTAVTSILNHCEQTAGGQRREFGQGFVDERQIWVDFRWPVRLADSRQAGLRQHAGNGVGMDAQLPGNCPNPPFFNVVKAQNLRLDFRGNGHCDALSCCSWDPGGSAGSHGGQTPDRGGRNNGSAIAAGHPGPSSSDPSRPPLSL